VILLSCGWSSQYASDSAIEYISANECISPDSKLILPIMILPIRVLPNHRSGSRDMFVEAHLVLVEQVALGGFVGLQCPHLALESGYSLLQAAPGCPELRHLLPF
jgi:hypothetical protein